jgi:hypothetical protein
MSRQIVEGLTPNSLAIALTVPLWKRGYRRSSRLTSVRRIRARVCRQRL